MKNENQIHTNVKYITFFIIIIGFLFPYTTLAQNQVKSSLPIIKSFTITHITPDKLNGNKTNLIEINWRTAGANKVRLYKNGVEIKGRTRRPNGEIGWSLTMKKGYYKRI